MQQLVFMYNILKINKNKLMYIYVNIILILLFSLIYWYYGTPEHLTFNPQFANNDNERISYLSALYFTCTTHSTVGYGDITPKSKVMQNIITIHLTILILNLSILIL